MGTDREDLETNLAASFDRDTLAVYADHLQSEGDPRGELIALDLQIEAHADPASARRYRYAPTELVARRVTLLTNWLRTLVPLDPTRGWIGDHVRFGFLDNLELGTHSTDARDYLLAILASPVGPYIRGITIRGATIDLEASIEILARSDHPWLARLTLHKRADGPLVPGDLVERIIAATPRLARLELSGHRALDDFAHPALHEVRIDGRASLDMFATGSFRGVSLLDLGLGDDEPVYLAEDRAEDTATPDVTGEIAKLFVPEHLSALRRLDLSRNEPAPAVPDYYDDDADLYGELADVVASAVDPFELIGILPLRRQLTHLKLPALRTEQDFTRLADAAAAMPALTCVEIARGHYYRAPALPHATARFVRPPAWPWPAPASIRPGESLRVAVPGSRSGDLVGLADAVAVMERRFEELPADARYAWTRLWLFVGELALDREQRFPADVLTDALESCELPGGWRELRDELRFRRPLPAGATVAVRRTL